MTGFCCPVCGEALRDTGSGSLRCSNGHSFDIARQGFVNLLLTGGAAGKRHGDDRLMVDARRAFLEAGYYNPVREGIVRLLLPKLADGCVLMDAGCGEGWYSAGLSSALSAAGISHEIFGIDISRTAIQAAAARHAGLRLAVASTAHIPMADGSCDAVLNLFSPLEAKEYHRVLKAGGTLLRAVPRERHLFSLKAAVYDKPYENDPQDMELPGFAAAERCEIDAAFRLPSNEAVRALFCMTPYYYKTSRADQAKLAAIQTLDTALSVLLLAHRKL